MRPVIVSVGPLASGSANNIATSQSPAGTSGRAAATFTANSSTIAATNSFVAGQAVTFVNVGGTAGFTANSGTVVPAGYPTGIAPGSTYFVLSSGLSGSDFEVAITPGGTAIAPASIGSGTQYVVWGANVAINGTLVDSHGVAILDSPRRILITTADTTTLFTVTGRSPTDTIISEIVGPISTSGYTVQDFAKVTSITVNQAPTAAVTVGTNGVASTPWVRFDDYAPGGVSIQCNASGTVNYTINQTLDDPDSPTSPVLPAAMTWINTSDTNGVGATASIQSNYQFAPVYARVTLNSGTGSVTATFVQSDVGPY